MNYITLVNGDIIRGDDEFNSWGNNWMLVSKSSNPACIGKIYSHIEYVAMRRKIEQKMYIDSDGTFTIV